MVEVDKSGPRIVLRLIFQPTLSTIKLRGRLSIHGIDTIYMALRITGTTVIELMRTRTVSVVQDAMTLTVSLHAAQLDACADA